MRRQDPGHHGNWRGKRCRCTQPQRTRSGAIWSCSPASPWSGPRRSLSLVAPPDDGNPKKLGVSISAAKISQCAGRIAIHLIATARKQSSSSGTREPEGTQDKDPKR